MTRLRSIGTNPTIRNFARDASQSAIRKVANFVAPTVEVPTLTGQYKIYDAKHRYKRPNTLRNTDGKATRIGFTAKDAKYNLIPHALDFPIPNVETLNDEGFMNQVRYGTTLLADSSGLDHEANVIDTMLEQVGAGDDVDFKAANFDPIDYLDKKIIKVMKLAKNGAGIRILFGPTAERLFKNNSKVLYRFNGGGGKALKVPTLTDLSDMLIGKPEIETALMVHDAAPEGKEEDIQFLVDEAIIVFACNPNPNTMDPSFMKTFRLMGQWMRPGAYKSEDERDDILKMDWIEEIVVTNGTAADRTNAKEE
ncbi:MAG: hypothetical protein LBV12_06405 [Puniceicoccales bacterium]|jgi:hypothetical protein|nr:hypothetical protein [Puniceicoccales bacterium]